MDDNGHSRRARAERLLEEGAALMELDKLDKDAGHPAREAGRQSTAAEGKHFDVIVVGGGQAGLSVGHLLARRGLRFLILDACDRVGDAWRKRWDSLRLFTPARFNGLVGMPFPAPGDYFPTKDEMADYLESYAARFDLPVRNGARVERLWRENGRFRVALGGEELEADQVVVAMSNYQRPKVPELAKELRSDITQIHSLDYRNPSQLRDGPVLVVGAGNSGAEIGLEAARAHETWLSGRDVGQIPFRIDGFLGRLVLVRLVLRGVYHRILTVTTPVGRKARPKILVQASPLIRTKRKHLKAAGVRAAPKVVGVRNGLPVLEDGRVLDVANVVWCTGYHAGFSWIDLPVFDEDGHPRHRSGVAEDVPGLYFVGLHFLHSLSSAMVHGVARDAERVVDAVAARATETADRPRAGDGHQRTPRSTAPAAQPSAR
ncbi:MAG: flavin-containing monooxygenase [Myxococcota bacterium]